MPWQEASTVSLRADFVAAANDSGEPIRVVCRRFGISPQTAYKWLGRYQAEGVAGLVDRPRRPRESPTRTNQAMEQAVLDLRAKHPTWGGRKLRARLRALGHEGVPSASTITAILHRHGRIDPAESAKHRPFQRFERPTPNDLWQMDFKGYFPLSSGHCHPLTVLDDHSRYCVELRACSNEQTPTVQDALTHVFRQYGLPTWMLMDNGPPWGSAGETPYTALTVWLLQLGVRVTHGRPHHPQTQGKDERFHRTLRAELLTTRTFPDLLVCQQAFDQWRDSYNCERPHDALELGTPASRYQPSSRPFPETLPPIEYEPGTVVRKVQDKGEIWFQGKPYRVASSFRGYHVALQPTELDHIYAVWFGTFPISQIDCRQPEQS